MDECLFWVIKWERRFIQPDLLSIHNEGSSFTKIIIFYFCLTKQFPQKMHFNSLFVISGRKV